MALELNKEISFGKKKGSSKKGNLVYPSKTYINLMPMAAAPKNVGRNIIIGVFLVLFVVAFVKFGVIDFYGRVNDKQAELTTQQQSLSAVQSKLSSYESVVEEFEGYEVASLASAGVVMNAVDALNLVDQCVRPYADVSALSLKNDTLLLNLTNTSLDNLGQLSSALESRPEVKGVTVSTASSKQDSEGGTSATVTVTLQSDSQSEEGKKKQ